MSGMRKVVGAMVLVVSLVAGASCTAPPEQAAEELGRGLGFAVTMVILTALCEATPGCESPICMMVPCLPSPRAVAPVEAAPESLVPS
jgi:hypothetical protein